MSHIVRIFTNIFGDSRKHNEGKGQITFDCPKCSEDKGLYDGDGKGNLEINYKRGLFKCWSCPEENDMHGVVDKLIKRYGSKETYKEYNTFKPDYEYTSNGDVKIYKHKLTLPKGFKFLSECVGTELGYKAAKKYLANRNIGDDIIKRYNIGYTRYGKFTNRIIIPSYDVNGSLNYFIARRYDNSVKYKYLNPDAEKLDIIFNEHMVCWDSTIYLVEGAFDHIVIPNSIPLLGKDLPKILFDKLQELAKGYVVIVLDGDARKNAEFLYKRLDTFNLRGRVLIVTLEENSDASLIYQQYGYKGIYKLLKNGSTINEFDL